MIQIKIKSENLAKREKLHLIIFNKRIHSLVCIEGVGKDGQRPTEVQ